MREKILPVPSGAEPYYHKWISLTPAQRLRRSWRLRRRIQDHQAVHDAKTL